jgi:hypothetical protein
MIGRRLTQDGMRRLVDGVAVAAFLVTGTAMIVRGLVPDRPPAPSPAAYGSTASHSATEPARSSRVPVMRRSVPVHLEIPAIGVDTTLMRLGLNDDGTMAVPPLTKDAPAGWYEHLPTPGELGPAVIVGHLDTSRFGPAVFFRLGALRPGDVVSVRRADGSTAIFSIVKVATFPKAAFPAGTVYGAVDVPGLRLITCGGSFDRDRRTYRDSIVAFATLTASSGPSPDQPSARYVHTG